ncbi:helix-turn-helix domain-containing protein [Buchananella felis]|uniref:helix-turn-helix domain-containing protein n=1 Tax=Buchananella felis TaxID=3231492 RepID=UPI00352897D5
MTRRFFTVADVAEQLGVSVSAVRAMLHSGELLGIQVGGKNVWRIEDSELDAYIERAYAANKERIAAEGFRVG